MNRCLGAILFTAAAPLAASSPASATLVAYYQLDDISGDAIDSSGNGLDMGAQGGDHIYGVASVSPTYGAAVRFDGVNDEFGRGGAGSPQLNALDDSFTVAAWINPAKLSGDQLIFAASGQKWGFGLFGDDLRFTTYGVLDYDQTAGISANTWTHVALTFGTDHDADFYVNGSLVGTVPGNDPANSGQQGNWFIGSRGFGATYFDGAIDEVRIYSTELSLSEIAALAAVPEPSAVMSMSVLLTSVCAKARRRRA